jgi:hypothetical protein
VNCCVSELELDNLTKKNWDCKNWHNKNQPLPSLLLYHFNRVPLDRLWIFGLELRVEVSKSSSHQGVQCFSLSSMLRGTVNRQSHCVSLIPGPHRDPSRVRPAASAVRAGLRRGSGVTLFPAMKQREAGFGKKWTCPSDPGDFRA